MRKRFNFISVRRISKKKNQKIYNSIFMQHIILEITLKNNRYKSRTLLMVKSFLKDIKKNLR